MEHIANGSFDQKIAESKLRLLATQNGITILASNLGVPTVVFSILYLLGDADFKKLCMWLGTGYVLGAIRFVHNLKLQKFDSSDHTMRRWEFELVALSAMSGFFWSASGILFLDPDSPTASVVLIAANLGVLAGAVPALASHTSIFFAFVLSSWLPAAIYYVILGTPFFYGMAIIGLFYFVIIVSFSASQRRTVQESLRLRYENIELLEELRIQKQRAEDASIAKSRFLAVASHDLRQPIHAIRLFSDSLMLRAKDDGTKAIMEMLRNSIDTLSGLFGSLLDMSKLEAQAIQPEMARIKVDNMLKNLFTEFSAQCLEKKLRCVCKAKPNLIVETDPVLLERILRNLIWNAIKYTSEGGILIAARQRGSNLRLEIWDTGCGIPEDELPKIFEEFHQVSSPNDEAREGIGLGLSIVNGLCRLLGYTVSLKSRVGSGSVFFVEMPLLESSSTPKTKSSLIRSSAPEKDTDLAGVQVLVVDDDKDIRIAMCHLLSEWDCGCISADTADAAIAALDDFTPDIILTDFHLRDSDSGDIVIERAQEKLGYAVPSIIITGDTSAEHLQAAQQRECLLLHKPVNTDELKASMIRSLNT